LASRICLAERHRIAEREHKCRRFPRQGLRHDLRRALGGPSNESDANALVGCSIELLGKPRGVAVSATDQPERTRSTDRSRQGAAASKRHRGRDDRMGDAKRLGEPSRNHPATISTAICADKRETRGEGSLSEKYRQKVCVVVSRCCCAAQQQQPQQQQSLATNKRVKATQGWTSVG
jgi:hypothetical protein